MRPAHYAPPAAVLRCARVALEALRRGRWWLVTGESNDNGRAG